MNTTHRSGATRRTCAAAATLAAACSLGLATGGAARASSTHSTDDFEFDADGLCAFTVHLTVHDEVDSTTQATATGSVVVDRVVETDSVSAHGVTVYGLPYHYTVHRVLDSQGDQLSAIAQGEEWRFRLPDGSVWSAGGRNDFLTEQTVGSWTFDDGLGPVCDALA